MNSMSVATAGVKLSPKVKDLLLIRFKKMREFSLTISSFLSTEDQQIQSMENASPIKWHLAHTTWFFETIILKSFDKTYELFDPMMNALYNSYYNSLGRLFPRHKRGMITKPNLEEVLAYREYVDKKMIGLLSQATSISDELSYLISVGINHEEQHQELMLTDIKHAFFYNPLYPKLNRNFKKVPSAVQPQGWLSLPGGVYEIGADKEKEEFSYDNENPLHKTYLEPFEIASSLVTNQAYIEFIESGGYEKALLWLSEGWAFVERNEVKHPLYWIKKEGTWYHFTLNGLEPLDPLAPVCHINFYEANAYAKWKDCRLPTEAEWEAVTKKKFPNERVFREELEKGNFADNLIFDPVTLEADKYQFFGNVWEWTSSSYAPYPGFKTEVGALGEYNGKFMCNQYVLRGGSCATSKAHIRMTYRNFFSADSSWQFTGIRLARS